MRLPMPPSPTIVAFAADFDKVFQGVDFSFFVAFMSVFCQGHDDRTITQVQQAAVFERDYSRFWNFLDGADFDDDEMYRIQVGQLVNYGMKTRLPDEREVFVGTVDDTLNRRPYGPKLFGSQIHHDHAAKSHQSTFALGQNQVALGLVPDALDPDGARCFLLDSELYVSEKEALEAGHDTLAFETRLVLASLLVERFCDTLDDEDWFYVLCDAWYTKLPFLQRVLKRDRTHVIGRLQKNRVLYELPEQKPPGAPGRPRKYGSRWDWEQALQTEGVEIEQLHYGRVRRLRYVAKVVRLKKFDPPVMVIAAQYIDRADSEPVLFLCTDTELDPELALELYCARFSEEEAFKDARQVIGWGTERVRGRRRWLRYMRLMFLAFGWLRMIAEGQSEAIHERLHDNWRKRQPRLTLGQVQQGLRYESWRGERVFRTSGFDPDSPKTRAAYRRAVKPQRKHRSSRSRWAESVA